METTTLHPNHQKYQSWLGILALVLFALLYCWSALDAPFWNDNDTWSNLLPVIHFRHSILDQHTLPLYTDLWYGPPSVGESALEFFISAIDGCVVGYAFGLGHAHCFSWSFGFFPTHRQITGGIILRIRS